MIKKIINKLFDIHPNAMSFKQGLDLTGLPIISLYQGNKTFNFILDTGSDISMVNSYALEQMEHTKVEGIEGEVYGVDGNRVKSTICTIPLSYKDQSFVSDFHVRDMSQAFGNLKKDHGVNLHGLLGSQFFNKYRYILDFAELIAYSKE